MTREEARIEIEEEFKLFLEGASLDDAEILEEEMKKNTELRKVVEANRMAIKALEQNPCKDVVSRQAVLDAIESEYKDKANEQLAHEIVNIMAIIDAVPPVNSQPKIGHWIEIAQYSDGKHKIECSECGSHIFDRGHANSFNVKKKYKYCPNCGAKMIEPQESEDK